MTFLFSLFAGVPFFFFSPQMWLSPLHVQSGWRDGEPWYRQSSSRHFFFRLQVALDESHGQSDNAMLVSTCSLHVSCGRGFVEGGPGHVLFRFLQSRSSSPNRGCHFCECHSRDKEVFRVHIVVASPLLVADITYFVEPNFVLPALSLSRIVQQLRLLSVVHVQCFAAFLHVATGHAS